MYKTGSFLARNLPQKEVKDAVCQWPYWAYYALCSIVANSSPVVSDAEGKEVSNVRNTKMYQLMLLRRKAHMRSEAKKESEVPTLCLNNASRVQFYVRNVMSTSMNKYCLYNTSLMGFSGE